ncbi:MAG: LacI family DNA-binding transcriptional regulator [Rhodospirillales bacterium]|nr:LacI family DNA-binding transcriptional regulator [Rhodospirillales bacterium]
MSKSATPSGISKRPRISDIARAAGVSVATVDRVLHGRPGVKKQTTDLIQSTMDRLAYGTPASHLRTPQRKLKFDVILPVGPNSFMDMLADELRLASDAIPNAGVTLNLHRIDRFDPQVLTDYVRRIAPETDGIAVVAVENPMVREAINEIASAGIPVVTLVSDLSSSRRLSYVGLDNRAAGRTAGHLMGRLMPPGAGKVILLAGSLGLNYRDHEEREMGFQRVLKEQFPALQIIERLESHDDYQETYRQIKSILERDPDITGIYNISAGNRGVGAALEETGFADRIVFIGHELTTYSRQYLINGTMDAVIDQSPSREAERTINILYNFHQISGFVIPHEPIPIQIFVSENLP